MLLVSEPQRLRVVRLLGAIRGRASLLACQLGRSDRDLTSLSLFGWRHLTDNSTTTHCHVPSA
jgi:hypothetical protein